jgi:hypothetical protein
MLLFALAFWGAVGAGVQVLEPCVEFEGFVDDGGVVFVESYRAE